MKPECCILFLHHRNDELTRRHFRLLQEQNPAPVIAIYANQREHLPEAVDVGPLGDVWRNADLAFLNWFRRRPFDAERYLWLEYDTFASLPVRDCYEAVWDRDAVAAKVIELQPHADWCWFAERNLLPPDLRASMAGLSPLCGILLSHRALCALANTAALPPVFSELRLGTVLRAAGFELSALPPERAATIDWNPAAIAFNPAVPGVYHPVKH